MATIAKPSRAIPSRALVERARPSRARRLRPAYVYRFGDLVERETHAEAEFGRLGPAWTTRGGRIVQAPEDVPSYDDHGIRIRRRGRNDLDYSEDFGDDYWVKNGTTTVEPGYPDPRGGNDAYLVTLDPTVGNALWRAAVPGDPGAAYTASWHVRRYDVDGEVTAASADNKSGPRDASSVTLTDEWQRVGVTHVQAADASGTHVILSGTQTTATRFLAFGAMRNPGERMDDYIPTNGAAATRLSEAADGAGNGLGLPLADDMAAAMGGLRTEEYLGPDLIVNGTFDHWTDDDPDGWQISIEGDPSPVVTEVEDGCRIYAPEGGFIQMASQSVLEAGKEYELTFSQTVTTGAVQFVTDQRTFLSFGGSTTDEKFRFVADGDTFRLKRNGETDVVVHKVEVREVKTRVLTPTGDELIDTVTAWQLNAGWSDDGVDAVSADGAAPYSNAYKVFLTAGERYIVTCDVVVTAGSIRFQGNTDPAGASEPITESGTYALEITTNGGPFKALALADGFSGAITNISVKPVTPQYAISMTFVADIASADIDTPLSILGMTGVSRYDGIHADPDDVIRGGFIGLPAVHHAGWQRGDRVKIAAIVDAAADIAVLACRINDGDVTISQSSYAPDIARSISDAISPCTDGAANDYIVPMSCVEVAMYPHVIPATTEDIANA